MVDPTTRPRFHLTAPANWMNDPNGPIFWRGRYHLFYQHNPDAPAWGRIAWGHASSADLVRWTHHPIALAPSTDGPDRDGCWSGCARVIDGRPTVFYTSVVGHGEDHRETVSRAVGEADLETWTKDPANPLIGPRAGTPDLGHYRDPFVFRDGDVWRMLLSTGITGPDGTRSGAVISFISPDLDTWSYAGVVLRRPAGIGSIETGPVWECPQLARIDGRWVLIVSVQDTVPTPQPRDVVWFIGDYADGVFEPRTMGRVDHGDVFYAPAILEEPSGRVLLWGWLQDHAPLAIRERAGFAGAMSLPREVRVRDGWLLSRPVDELEALWATDARHVDELTVEPGAEHRLGAAGSAFRLSLAVETGPASGIAVVRVPSADPDVAAAVVISVDGRASPASLSVSTTHPATGEQKHATTVPPSRADRVALRIHVDGPIVEVFADAGVVALTVRADPAFGAAGDVDLLAVDGPVRWSSVDLRPLA